MTGTEEADQTRGRDARPTPSPNYPLPYRACIVLGFMMGEDGLKMSKRLKNYKDPSYVFDQFGADAMRWFFFSAQTPWTSVRFQESGIRDAQREFLVRLYNVFSFFNIYANIDGFEVGRHEGTEARRHAGAAGEEEPQEDPQEEPQASACAAPGSVDGIASAEPRGLKSTARPTGWHPVTERSELDRWVISELHLTIRAVRESLDRFENYPAAKRLNAFVDALSNWYVRRSRDRFWKSVMGSGERGAGSADVPSTDEPRASARADVGRDEPSDSARVSDDGSSRIESGAASEAPRGLKPAALQGDANANQDKWDAYNTLYECLLTLSKLIAPFTPFFAETMYGNLDGSAEARRHGDQGSSIPAPLSVHLCDYPEPDGALIDEALAGDMELVREIASLGRAARTDAKLKVRQPLARVEIMLARPEREAALRAYSDLLAEELNVKLVEFTANADHYVEYQVKPDFKAIGPKYGKLAPRIAGALKKLEDPAEARRALAADGKLALAVDGQTIELGADEVEIRLAARAGWSAAQGRCGVVVVGTELTDELRQEGIVRELIHHVQTQRKSADLAYEARIVLRLRCDDAFRALVEQFDAALKSECLVERIEFADSDAESIEMEGHTLSVAIEALA